MEEDAIGTVSIIGTAGRGTDLARLDAATYDRMATIAATLVREMGLPGIVSGGAAWADHLAVRLVVDGVVPAGALTLHLPCAFVDGRFSSADRTGDVANHYHRLFRRRTGVDSLGQIAAVVAGGATTTVGRGFFDRNRRVGTSDALLAFTFGGGAPFSMRICGNVSAEAGGLKDGGTANCWSNSAARTKVHVSLG